MAGTLDLDKILSRPKDDPAARVTRIAKPLASPAQCVLCGKSQHPVGFASFDNLDFEFFGSLYFCGDCVGDIARPFGFLGRDELEAIIAKLQEQETELKTLRSAVVNLENLIDAYTALRGTNDILAGLDSVRSQSATHVVQPSKEGVGSPTDGETGRVTESSTDESGVTNGDSTSDEHRSVEGLDDVRPSTADDNDPLGLAELGINL